MKALLKKSAILKTISSKICTYLHEIDADSQEDDSDFDDEEWMDYPTKPTLSHVILDLLLSPTYRLPGTVNIVRSIKTGTVFQFVLGARWSSDTSINLIAATVGNPSIGRSSTMPRKSSSAGMV